MKRRLVSPTLILLLVLASVSTACTSSVIRGPAISRQAASIPPRAEITLDVPYVPTPKKVVDEMLNIAKVGPYDTVYDLGCGDGRLVVTAAKERGAKGVGVDLNPARIKESKDNAMRAMVEDRVTFFQQDLFETDISEATVLTIYLLPDVNLRLRPRIFSQLKPGSRVVSHDYDMDDWKPDAQTRIGPDRIYYWVVPANVSGTWELTVQSGEGLSRYSLIIHQNFQKIGGIAISGSSQMVLKDARLKGEALEFKIEQRIDGKLVPMKFEGRIVGDSIQGTMSRQGKTKGEQGSWSAQRNPGSATPIDGSPDEKVYPGRWT